MNISYNWLRDLVETDLTPQEMAENLTSVGLAVEAIHPHEDDFVFDIDLTSNRGDCLSHLGVAREICAVANSKLKIHNSKLENPQSANRNPQLVDILDTDLCLRFTAQIIRGVKIGPSPDWLVKRLETVGERSINNVADITNFVMHELGNPMHAFDFNKLKEQRIVVRRARSGETIKTLDEADRELNESMLMICDAEKPIAVGGIMGGFDSAISNSTTDVLLEVAYFKGDSIRKTSRELKLSTEASHRFERGVDFENLIRASNRATALICELAGGTAGEFIDSGEAKYVGIEVELRPNQVTNLTGLDVSPAQIDQILLGLGIEAKTRRENSTIYSIPAWRHDITIEANLIEEVARHIGYDKIGEELPPSRSAGEYQPNEIRKKQLRRAMTSIGFNEAISYSFIDAKYDETFDLVDCVGTDPTAEKFITLQDSIIDGAIRMRPGLLSGLVEAVRTNFNFQNRNIRLFELGKVFAAAIGDSSALPIERELFSFVMTGNETWQNQAILGREFDFADAKGALESATGALNVGGITYQSGEIKHLRKGQSAKVFVNGKPIGSIGRLNDEIALNFKFKQPVYLAEIDLQLVLEEPQNAVFYRQLSKFPGITRDVSLLINRSTEFAEILEVIDVKDFGLLKSCSFVDVYEGIGIGEHEKSLTIRLEYRSELKTLTEAEVEEIHEGILTKLRDKLGAKLRF